MGADEYETIDGMVMSPAVAAAYRAHPETRVDPGDDSCPECDGVGHKPDVALGFGTLWCLKCMGTGRAS